MSPVLAFASWLAFAGPAEPQKLAPALIEGAVKVLELDKHGLEDLQRTAVAAADDLDVQAAIGAGALVLGDRTTAQRVLARVPAMAAYYAMSEFGGAGGNSRATTTSPAPPRFRTRKPRRPRSSWRPWPSIGPANRRRPMRS